MQGDGVRICYKFLSLGESVLDETDSILNMNFLLVGEILLIICVGLLYVCYMQNIL